MDLRRIWRVWTPLVIGAWALGVIYARGSGPHGLTRVLGLGVAMAGLGGIVLARHTLGDSFSVAPEARALVTNGIYSRIRNPIYICGIVTLTGVALMLQHPYLFLLFCVAIPAQIFRARREARVLEEKFGEEYREYRRRTWF